MKNTNYLLTALTLGFLLMSCDSTRCDAGYTDVNVNGQDICMPDYVVGEIQNLNLGNEFYHQKYGVISFNNGNWITNKNMILTDSELND
jgi:hypothetical protein